MLVLTGVLSEVLLHGLVFIVVDVHKILRRQRHGVRVVAGVYENGDGRWDESVGDLDREAQHGVRHSCFEPDLVEPLVEVRSGMNVVGVDPAPGFEPSTRRGAHVIRDELDSMHGRRAGIHAAFREVGIRVVPIRDGQSPGREGDALVLEVIRSVVHGRGMSSGRWQTWRGQRSAHRWPWGSS